jgi:DNA-directed RNA polymerase specialized sigma24 family protein
MPAVQLHTLLRRLQQLTSHRPEGGLSDAELLGRFAAARDEAAFEVLVWRHGPMVLNLCRRLLRHTQDVEDAFQATFLALVRKAAAIRRRASLGSWLYKVARRVAVEAKTRAPRPVRAGGGGRGCRYR